MLPSFCNDSTPKPSSEAEIDTFQGLFDTLPFTCIRSKDALKTVTAGSLSSNDDDGVIDVHSVEREIRTLGIESLICNNALSKHYYKKNSQVPSSPAR